ncbi:MAG: hypothetical protein PHQ40_19780 [Anaerolineaceae bacterium]|nr:hypothetical protein [Anaerolineaceae bacterium]
MQEPFIVDYTGQWKSIDSQPSLTVLNYSGGKQSSALLWMVILGHIKRPDNFIVVNANPGMENSLTYKYIDMMEQICIDNGIQIIKAKGPNLYEDLINFKKKGAARIDNPPYWVDKMNGTKGRLVQGCTKFYKIAPMDRVIREHIKGSRLTTSCVHKWIGFSKSEVHRIKPPSVKYTAFRYPLIEMGLTNEDIINYYDDNFLPVPPRSVCNACFANGLDMLKEMYERRPEDWEKAVAVDEAVRDMRALGIKYPVYVSATLKPLRILAEEDFYQGDKSDSDDESCTSGYCFV